MIDQWEVRFVIRIDSKKAIKNSSVLDAVADVISNDDVTTEMILDHINEYEPSAKIKGIQILVKDSKRQYSGVNYR